MALVSTLVFHGAWQKQFLITETQNLPFTFSDGSTVKVPMMYQSSEVNIGKGVNKEPINPCFNKGTFPQFTHPLVSGHFRLPSEQEYTVLELPYLDRSLRLLVALPSDRKTPLSQLEKQITARAVGLWDTGLRRTKMDIFLPRYSMKK